MIQFTPRRRRLKFRLIFFVVFFTITSSGAFAQFITPIIPLSLTQQQNKIKEKVMNNSFFKNMQFVQMGNLPALQVGGVLRFTIPGRKREVEAHATRVKSYSVNNYEWYASIDSGLGTMIVLNRNGKISASIYLQDGEVYEIISTDNNAHILLTYDKTKSETLNNCGTKNESNNLKKSKDRDNSNNNNASRVLPCQDNTRVLVLYTPAAEAAVADINQTIDLCISQFNQAIYHSAITTDAYVELAGSQLYNFTETIWMGGDLGTLINDATVQTLRNNANADYVILLTNGNYNGDYGQAGTLEPNDANSYAIVQAVTATNERKSFSHEAGHLYGCRHDNDTAGQAYAHGYIFRPSFLAPRCYTLMVNGGEITDSRSRLLNFSNPNVFISGAPTGTASANNNARRVSETYSTLRNFRSSPFRPLTAAILGTQTGNECTQGDWEAVVSCGTAPYTYSWSTSYDGFTYSYQSSNEFFSSTLTCPVGLYQNLYIRLDVQSSNGQTATSFLTVYVNGSGGPQYRVITKNETLGKPGKNKRTPIPVFVKGKSNLLSAYPNPAKNTTRIEINLVESQPVKLEIFNSFGEKIKTVFEGSLPSGKHSEILNTSGWAKGAYLYKLTGRTFNVTKKLVIQ